MWGCTLKVSIWSLQYGLRGLTSYQGQDTIQTWYPFSGTVSGDQTGHCLDTLVVWNKYFFLALVQKALHPTFFLQFAICLCHFSDCIAGKHGKKAQEPTKTCSDKFQVVPLDYPWSQCLTVSGYGAHIFASAPTKSFVQTGVTCDK